jgi:CHAT domain-containing protein/tetratricopeptide (TPR) repeat protein
MLLLLGAAPGWAQKSDLSITIQEISRLHQAGKIPEAVSMARRALAIAEQEHGPDAKIVDSIGNSLAKLYVHQRRYVDAISLYKKSLAFREKLVGPDHPDVAAILFMTAQLYLELNRYSEAEPLYKRSLAIREKKLGPDHVEVGATLSNLAKLLDLQHRYTEALSLYERAVVIVVKTLGTDNLVFPAILFSIAKLNVELKRYTKAETAYKLSLKVREEKLGRDHAEVGATHNSLAKLYSLQLRYPEAIVHYKRGLAIREKDVGPDHLDVATMLFWIARLHAELEHYAEAEPLYKRSLSIREKKLGPDHVEVGTVLNNLASLYSDQGRYAEAEPLHRRDLAIREGALGRDHVEVGTTLNNLAAIYGNQGLYDKAEPLYKRSLAISERALGRDHVEVGTTLNNLAGLYRVQGRYAEAEPLFKRVIEIYEKRLGPAHQNVGISVNNLAALYERQGRYLEAIPLYKRTIEIFGKTIGPDHVNVASALSNFAVIYNGLQRYDKAEQLYWRSLEIYQKAFGPNHPSVGVALNNLAALYIDQGRYSDAELLFKRTVAVFQKTLGTDHPDFATALSHLAAVYYEQKNWELATNYLRRGTDVIKSRVRRGNQSLQRPLTGKKRNEATRARRRFSVFVKAAHRLASVKRNLQADLLQEMFLAAQWPSSSQAAAALARMSARKATGDSTLTMLARTRQDLVSDWQKRDKLRTAAIAQAPQKHERNAKTESMNIKRLAAIDARVAEIDKRLAKEFPDYAALTNPEPLSVNNVQSYLGADEALVFFLDTAEYALTPEETFIWVVTKKESRWVRSSLGTQGLRDTVDALRCGLDSTNWIDASTWSVKTDDHKRRKHQQVARRDRCEKLTGMTVSSSEDPPFDLARAYKLYKNLFGDIEPLIKDKHLLVVPSGPLTKLPFQVLVTQRPRVGTAIADAQWLIRRNVITVLPSVASLKALRRNSRASAAPRAFVGFGNPLLDGRQNDPDFGAYFKSQAELARNTKRCPNVLASTEEFEFKPMKIAGWVVPDVFAKFFRAGLGDVAKLRRLSPLPETADELCAVARAQGVDAGAVYLGKNATEETIKQLNKDGELARRRVLHFATHGLLAGETKRVAGSLAEPALVLTPPDKATEEDDGLLTASEVTQLKLDADWVVLSACNTAGGGGEVNAESLSGLARAFFYAGARALLVSHWNVDSHATVKLIIGAFAALKQDPTIGHAKALQSAMLAVMVGTTRRKTLTPAAHPAVWAPFVVVGEGGAVQ